MTSNPIIINVIILDSLKTFYNIHDCIQYMYLACEFVETKKLYLPMTFDPIGGPLTPAYELVL